MSLMVPLDALLVLLLSGVYLIYQPLLWADTFILPASAPYNAIVITLAVLYLAVACWLSGDRPGRWASVLSAARVGLALALVVGIALPHLAWAMTLRHLSGGHLYVHDGLIQTEQAARLLLAGRNPYAENYVGTPLQEWPFREGALTVNPALYHYIYLPLTFLLAVPLQWAAAQLAQPRLDLRLVLALAYALYLALVATLARKPDRRLTLFLFCALNPLFFPFFLEGRNDVLGLAAITLALVLLIRGRRIGSAIVLGLACSLKQTIWLMLPAYLVYATGDLPPRQRLVAAGRLLLPWAITVGVLLLPFVLWNPPAFVEDVISYGSGASAHSYPIRGHGFGTLLLSAGLLPSNLAAFPFALLQGGSTLLALFFLLRWQLRHNTLPACLLVYGLLLLVFGFFGRAFNDNHFGLAVTLLVIANLVDPWLGGEAQ